MRLLAGIVAIALVVVSVTVWYVMRPAPTEHQHAPGETYYTCPMHTHIVRDAPGDCPICGMRLVKKTRPTAASQPDSAVASRAGGPEGAQGTAMPNAEMAGSNVALSPTQRVLANVATTVAERRRLAPQLSVVGRIAFNESRIRAVSATVSGRVEALAVTFTGQQVRAGQALMRIYSPELLAAQQEYLAALRGLTTLEGASDDTRAYGATIAEGAAQRLRLLGQTPAQIRALAQGRTTGTATTVVSPLGGTVVRRGVAVGQYVGQGQPLLWLVPLDPVWVVADVYEQDLPVVRVGTRMSFTSPALGGREVAARVEFVDPFVDPGTRTVRVRASVRNPGGQLRPGMFVRARVLGTDRMTDGVAVPASAVLESGDRAVVWVEVRPGSFEPRTVTLGARADGWVEVLEGLRAGERVASSGAFLLDSESQLRGSGGAMPGMDM